MLNLDLYSNKRYTVQYSQAIDLARVYRQYDSQVYDDDKNISLPLHGYKPRGIWYAFGREWLDFHWSFKETATSLLSHLFEIEVNTDNFVKLSSEEELFRFNREYVIDTDENQFVNWEKVASKYDGLEIMPFNRMFTALKWYQTLDISSGCVWNLQKITNISRLD